MLKSIKILHDKVFYYDDVENDFESLVENVHRNIRSKYKIQYYDIPVCFDIETSSFYNHGEKQACMYIWMFSIDDQIIIGRTWDQFILLCEKLVKHFSLHWKFRRIIVYVHSLSFEFQWICKRFIWKKVFALDSRIPLTALTESGIEFRCSYRLSGYSLAKVGEHLVKYKVEKMVGDLDYNKLRLPADPEHNFAGTPLTNKEMGYCINDVRVLSAYIREKIENENGITKIPLTKTGYVRQYCKRTIYADHESKQFRHYRDLMLKLTIEPDEYDLLKEGFQGGFTHANAYLTGKLIDNVKSVDFCSKYPSMIVARMYPMGKGERIEIKSKKHFKKTIDEYCCIFRVRITGLKSLILYENYLSFSKCRNVVNPVLNNGRIVSADSLETTITNVDYEILKRCYKWEHFEVGTFYRYKKGYLPTDFIKCVLEFYRIKTELKDVENFELEYMQGKENLNSCYGMMVTAVLRVLFDFINDLEGTEAAGWVEHEPNKQEVIEKYNRSVSRFLFFPWGVFVTAYSRYDLWVHGILKVKDDYIYSDTDSIKFRNPGKHPNFIKEFNTQIGMDLLKAMRHHKLDPELIAPKTKEGKIKPLGIFEMDGDYSRFKTLGAKRYLVDDRKKGLQITVAGLPKKEGLNYISSFKDPFKTFTNKMKVPASRSGKQTATYIDYEMEGSIKDYKGNYGNYHELSGIHLENTSYDMSLASDYVNYLLSINDDFDLGF